MSTIAHFIRPEPPPADRLVEARRVIDAIRRERVEHGIEMLAELQQWAADVSSREAGYQPGVAEIAARLLGPLNLAELNLRKHANV